MNKSDQEKLLSDLKNMLMEAYEIKNGDWKTDRALFEQKTTTELATIRQLVEGYSNIIQSSVWFFKLVNYLKKHKKLLMLFILLIIIVVNLIQHIPLDYLWTLAKKFMGI